MCGGVGGCVTPIMDHEERHRTILFLLSEGRTTKEILQMHPDLRPEDVMAAAARGLEAMEAAPRVESRAERVARVRERHPRAFEPWSEEEDARLLRRFDEGAKAADLAKELGRPPNAVRIRLEKWLGPSWKKRGVGEGPGG